ncbi:hypothetical protein SAMN06265795_11454 [Noviherbaspirillum humi]|uniref:Uncharacterized protein n=1 Tax=Noviherbaspirillum humi TaxID=1688639 RepID=A0A239K227_9BURK|nr:hypothetical protein [Noviherbaspirillum humi]SNT11124.1 hypothetical protein SAMN06265795_11454 [Noviherbaspirillum humi]
MAEETVGKYKLHLIAFQTSAAGKWAPYLMIERFDDARGDFVCVREKERVAGEALFDSEEEAEEVARQHGNALLKSGGI